MPIPIMYRRAGGNLIESFSFNEVIAGRSYAALYGGAVDISGATAYRLASFAFAGYPTTSGGDAAAKNFDVIVNNNLTADGNIIVTMPVNAAAGKTITVDAAFKRVREGTTTTFGTATGSVTAAARKIPISISVSNAQFTKGDTMRITITTTGDAAPDTNYYFDPTSATEDFRIYIPFKIFQ